MPSAPPSLLPLAHALSSPSPAPPPVASPGPPAQTWWCWAASQTRRPGTGRRCPWRRCPRGRRRRAGATRPCGCPPPPAGLTAAWASGSCPLAPRPGHSPTGPAGGRGGCGLGRQSAALPARAPRHTSAAAPAKGAWRRPLVRGSGSGEMSVLGRKRGVVGGWRGACWATPLGRRALAGAGGRTRPRQRAGGIWAIGGWHASVSRPGNPGRDAHPSPGWKRAGAGAGPGGGG